MIELRGIEKTYRMGDNDVHALRGVDLVIDDGDFIAIMGPSGSGKSTLAHIIGLLDGPSAGSYRFDGNEVSRLSEDELAVLRRDAIGFVFQQFHLLPRMSAAENVSLPLLYSKRNGTDRAADRQQTQTLLQTVGLAPRSGHRPNELSGGQQQRVAIARALANRPRLLLADEPTGNLDSVSERDIMAALKELNAKGITIVIVTHEEEIGAQAKRLIRMRDGVVQSDERKAPLDDRAHSISSQKSHGARKDVSLIRDVFEHFRQGFRTLAANKVRTGLSMLGVLIGVASVVAMLALGRGATKAIETQLSSLGSNLLVLRSGAARVGGVRQEAGATTRLTPEDADALLAQVPSIKNVGPSVGGRGQLTYSNKNWSTQVQGVSTSYKDIRSTEPQVGRFFTEDENRRRARVAVIGATIVKELFGDRNPIGETIKINKIGFQVIGVLPEKGASGFRDQDDLVLVPLLTGMYRLLGKTYVDSIDLEIRSRDEMESAEEATIDVMTTRHRVPVSQREDAFNVFNMADIQSAVSASGKTMSALLASIAAISLLVGGIGIMNIMLVSVTERTKEIGLRKAIGAKRRDILIQFLVESVVVSVVGGLAGVALGSSIAIALSAVTGWTVIIALDSIALSFFFSALIGIVFGLYPARKASRLHPIEALRFE